MERLRASGITLARDGDRLKVAGPQGALTAELKREIADRKAELLRLLSSQAHLETGPAATDPGARRELSPNQERLWSLISRDPQVARYNLPFAVRLSGPLDVDALRRAIRCIVTRHEVLRSAVRSDDSGTYLESSGPRDVLLVEMAPAQAGPEWLERRVAREAEAHFALEQGAAVRALLLVLGEDEHLLIVTMHHFAADGASFDVFFDELSAAYASDPNDEKAGLATLPVQYHDYAKWRRGQLTAEGRGDAERFWQAEFEDAPSSLAMPRPDLEGHAHREELVVPESTVARVAELANDEATSPFVVSLAAYGLLLAHVTGETDVILCSPASGRESEEVRGLIGYFNNVLPLRLRIQFDATGRDMVQATRRLVLNAHAHQALPFQDIASLSTTRRLALTRGMFVYHGQPMILPSLEGVRVARYPVATKTADFDVGLTVSRTADGMLASLVYRTGALGTMDSVAFLEAYVSLVDRLANQPDLTGAELVKSVSLSLGERTVRATAPTHAGVVPFMRGSGPPEDPLELQLAVIWERVLEVRGISANHDFFDLGGHSLLAVRLLDTIEREMGRRLALSSIVRYPTVAAQAQALRDEGWSPPTASLVPLYDSVEGDPVVMLHSFEGHTFLFNELARRVGKEAPTYGIQAQGLAEGTLPHASVEEMATHYLHELEQHFGDRPITLVGMCFGNSLGVEMATRRAAGQRPVRLVLIDGAWEHLQKPDELGPTPPIGDLVVRRTAREVRRVQRLWTRARRAFSGSPYARREAAIRRRTARAWERYTPKPYVGEITLIRAHDTAKNPEKDWHVRAMSSIALGGLRTVTVPGHHFTILREPHVAAVASAVLGGISVAVDGS